MNVYRIRTYNPFKQPCPFRAYSTDSTETYHRDYFCFRTSTEITSVPRQKSVTATSLLARRAIADAGPARVPACLVCSGTVQKADRMR